MFFCFGEDRSVRDKYNVIDFVLFERDASGWFGGVDVCDGSQAEGDVADEAIVIAEKLGEQVAFITAGTIVSFDFSSVAQGTSVRGEFQEAIQEQGGIFIHSKSRGGGFDKVGEHRRVV